MLSVNDVLNYSREENKESSEKQHCINGISISPKVNNSVIKIWNNYSEYSDISLLGEKINEIFNVSSPLYKPHQNHKDVSKHRK